MYPFSGQFKKLVQSVDRRKTGSPQSAGMQEAKDSQKSWPSRLTEHDAVGRSFGRRLMKMFLHKAIFVCSK